MAQSESIVKLDASPEGLLCRVGDQTCGGCCWGSAVERSRLEARLDRHRRLFSRRRVDESVPSSIRLLVHELRARHGFDVLIGLLLWIPWLGPRLRDWLAPRIVCAFAAFESDENRQVGCLIHPVRWQGEDVRQQAAFRWLRGFGCGAADFSCEASRRFSTVSAEEQNEILCQLETGDWYDYSRAVVSSGSSAPLNSETRQTKTDDREPACPSSFTRQ